MFQENTKSEEAIAELKGIVNHEYHTFVNRDRTPSVDFESIRVDGLGRFEQKQISHKSRVMNIVFGDMFEEHAQERIHYISEEMWDGNYSIDEVNLIKPILRELHNKINCGKCINGHPLRIPTNDTINDVRKGGVFD